MKVIRYFYRAVVIAAAVALLAAAVFSRTCTAEGCTSPGAWRLPSALDRINAATEPVVLPEKMSILLVGVDARSGSNTMHCDAIHLVNMDIAGDRIELVNIPRGTYTYIPMPDGWTPRDELVAAVQAQYRSTPLPPSTLVEAVPPSDAPPSTVLLESPALSPSEIASRAWQMEQYISNVCEYVGFDAFVDRVEDIARVRVDYTVRVGFSQAEGLLRALQFDPAATLQFLRHRKTYSLGDVQRSYNQSLFLEDVLRQHAGTVAGLPVTAQAALYHLVDTDIPYGVARSLLDWVSVSPVRTEAGRIAHRTAPGWMPQAQEMRFDPEEARRQVEELYARLKRYDPAFSVRDVQPTLTRYINERLTMTYAAIVDGDLNRAREVVGSVVDQQLWHQVEEKEARERMMATAAILESTLTWFETHDMQKTLTLATSMVWNLELTQGSSEVARAIQDHLEELLRPRLSLP